MTILFKPFVLILVILVPSAHGRFLDDYIGKLSHLHSISRVSMAPSPAPRASQATAGAPSPSVDRHKAPSPPPPPPPPQRTQVFNVMSFGAVGDGDSDDTQAMKMAWDSACDSESESATLLVPKGHSFMVQSTIFTGPCKGNMVFQIDGTMMPPDGPESWPKGVSKRQWLVFYRINGMAMQGGGLIDGRGEKWWNLPCKPHKGKNGTTLPGPCDSPVALRFFMSSNLTVRGLKIKNSPQFHFRFDGCQNLHIESLVIKAPSLSPNTDGIHIENTSNVTLHNSIIANGDDCVSIGAGTHNVDIKNLTCGPSHGISIGSLGSRNSRACVSNITVTDSIIKHSDNGVRIKTWQGGSGSVSKVVFQSIHMDAVRNPIMIDQFYCMTKNCPNQTSAVWVSDIRYSNIRGTYDARSPPMHFGCSDSVPCSNLTLAEIELLPAQGEVLLDPFCWNAYGSMMTLSIPPAFCLLEGSPESVPEGDVGQC